MVLLGALGILIGSIIGFQSKKYYDDLPVYEYVHHCEVSIYDIDHGCE
jgi:hypothetical protein